MITNINLKNFRNFDDLNIKTNNSLVIFSGKNATGKTSVLEAIYLASTTKSHRTNEIDNIIKFNKDFAKVEIKDNKNYKVVISKYKKTLFINDKEIKKTGDYLGKLNVVMISPSDISLVTGAKLDRRRFLDLYISTINKKYLNESSNYKKLLNERNQLLKSDNVDNIMLDILTKSLCESLKYIYEERIKFLNSLNEYLKDISKSLGVDNINLVYEPTYNPNDIYNSFKNKYQSDIFNKVTSLGSHRDDFLIKINNLDSKEFASEGQARLIYISIKLSLKKIITSLIDEPILLLDDIYQALDNKKIEALTKYVMESKQVLITTTSILEIPDNLLSNALVIRIDNLKGE